jgi:hypothetical protein
MQEPGERLVHYSAAWDVANLSLPWKLIDVSWPLWVVHNSSTESGLEWMGLHLHYVIVDLGRKGIRLDYCGSTQVALYMVCGRSRGGRGAEMRDMRSEDLYMVLYPFGLFVRSIIEDTGGLTV